MLAIKVKRLGVVLRASGTSHEAGFETRLLIKQKSVEDKIPGECARPSLAIKPLFPMKSSL